MTALRLDGRVMGIWSALKMGWKRLDHSGVHYQTRLVLNDRLD